ncbi:DUF1330 domain-containing protein [Novosphingopyxis baekryungensis]|uniref:DUF1330 domain-containing protein n=1 Tax=Novosphingopyxis baekryungensis TaxID=279369 RepID=UPI0003B5165F|nr:DUF1330 domain-containing protein [Novosphingopyxis baekryungensis]
MSAYLIVARLGPVEDEQSFAEYQRKTRLKPPSVALEPLVVYGAIHGLEGTAPDGVVMLRFDSVEDAKRWYEDPAYQDALPHRLKAANYQAFIVEGVAG